MTQSALLRYNTPGEHPPGALRLPEQEQSQEQEQQHRVSPRQHLKQWLMVNEQRFMRLSWLLVGFARSEMPEIYGCPAAINLREVQDAVRVRRLDRRAKEARPRAFS
ncbi:MAG: hypothetical protein R3E79_56985 [Caldilineaceae bacterium]